jgi:hypothetical protein
MIEDSRDRLQLEIAARVTDNRVPGSTTAQWLHAVRLNYRHMAASVSFIPAVTPEGVDRAIE